MELPVGIDRHDQVAARVQRGVESRLESDREAPMAFEFQDDICARRSSNRGGGIT